MTDDAIYFVTDIECDGFAPGDNSMLAFASVAVTADGAEQGRFECVLAGLPNAGTDPNTMAWWKTQPEAWAASTKDPRDPAEVMSDFLAWVLGFADTGATRVFAASPVAFDGVWIDYYLRRFTPYGLCMGPEDPVRPFDHTLCLRSYTAAVTGRPVSGINAHNIPQEWLGDIEHTHRAIDDALGYAHLLGELFARTAVSGV